MARRKRGKKKAKSAEARKRGAKKRRGKSRAQKIKPAMGRKAIDTQIVQDEPVFGEKHPLCAEVAHFYTLSGQLNLVLHGVPFHLIKDQFVRFHAVQSTLVGWKFTIIYTAMLVCTFANALLFSNRYLGWIAWAFVVVAAIHAVMNLYLAYKTRRGEEATVPVLSEMARKIAG